MNKSIGMDIPASKNEDCIVLHVRLTPKSGAAFAAGIEHYDGRPVLKMHVTAPPDEGKANAAMIEFLAGWLGVPKSMVTLVSGRKSRLKSVAVSGNPEELIAKLIVLLEELGHGGPNRKRKR